jgi:hypothetical protein
MTGSCGSFQLRCHGFGYRHRRTLNALSLVANSAPTMVSARTRVLLAAASLTGGILAGGIVDRVIVGGPAWQQIGIGTWAQFSRHADLGAGLVAYPVEGIGATLLSIATAISYYFDRIRRRDAAIPMYLAALLYIVGLVLTARAAPIMLGLSTPQSADALSRAFDDFYFWGLYLRGATDLLAFLAQIWAFVSLSGAE